MMTFSPVDYMAKTRETAQYPPDMALPYLALGLTSEVGEFAGVLNALSLDLDNLKKEAGDILWYCFRMLDELPGDTKPDWGAYTNRPGYVYYYEREAAIPSLVVIRMVLGLYNDAAAIADVVKKSVRDNSGKVPAEKFDGIVKRVDNIIFSVAEIAQSEAWLNLDAIAAANIAKLASRKQRGVIAGSGDNR